jgi:biotin transport system substrate-specific component
MAFPFAASLTGLLAERGWDRNPFTMFAAMLTGSTVIFGLGLMQLSRFVPADALLGAGLLPFIPGDLIKSALAAGVFPLVWKLVSRSGDRA